MLLQFCLIQSIKNRNCGALWEQSPAVLIESFRSYLLLTKTLFFCCTTPIHIASAIFWSIPIFSYTSCRVYTMVDRVLLCWTCRVFGVTGPRRALAFHFVLSATLTIVTRTRVSFPARCTTSTVTSLTIRNAGTAITTVHTSHFVVRQRCLYIVLIYHSLNHT